MTSFRRIVSFAGVPLALALALAGCNGSGPGSVTSSSAPGATIQGSIQGGAAGSASAHAASAASKIRISVMGTGLSTVSDGSGHFTLTGVPGGNASLRFEGPGVDATLEIGGLAEGQVLSITVHLSGSRASLVSPGPARPEEFKGLVESIAPPSLKVAGRLVITDAQTEFKGEGRFHSLADLRVGDRVKVEAVPMGNGSFLAREIKRLDEQGNVNEGEVEFRGVIQSITPPTLMVAGRTVLTDANTEIERQDHHVGLADLQVGDEAKVEGMALADGRVLAREIKVGGGGGHDGGDDDHQGDDDDEGDDGGSGGDDGGDHDDE